MSNDKCVFCKEGISLTGHKDKWICSECLTELYPLFKTHNEVIRVMRITRKIEKAVDKAIGGKE